MAGRPKQGIDYSGWSVNIFDGDTKIDKLLDAQGWVGFSIYFYLCQMAYKFDGYFYRWSYDDSATTARRMSGGVSSKTLENTVGLCLQIGLFDKPLFDRHGILTSKGIQRRYLAAIRGRRVKSVIADYWLLKDEEFEGLEKCALNDDYQPENINLQGADGHLQGADGYKSKVKESKVKEREKENTQKPLWTAGQSKPPTFEEVFEAAKLQGIPDLARPFFDYYDAADWRDSEGRPVYSWKAKLVAWKVREDDRLRKQIAAERRIRDDRYSVVTKVRGEEKKSFAELAREMEEKKDDI